MAMNFKPTKLEQLCFFLTQISRNLNEQQKKTIRNRKKATSTWMTFPVKVLIHHDSMIIFVRKTFRECWSFLWSNFHVLEANSSKSNKAQSQLDVKLFRGDVDIFGRSFRVDIYCQQRSVSAGKRPHSLNFLTMTSDLSSDSSSLLFSSFCKIFLRWTLIRDLL